jgi:hypothetical protein
MRHGCLDEAAAVSHVAGTAQSPVRNRVRARGREDLQVAPAVLHCGEGIAHDGPHRRGTRASAATQDSGFGVTATVVTVVTVVTEPSEGRRRRPKTE